MNYSDFLKLHEELSLLLVIVLLLMYDIFAGDGLKRYFQPVALLLFSAHTILNCVPRDSFEVAGGMYHYFPMLTYMKTILNVGTIIVFLQAHNWLNGDESIIRRGEFYFLTLSTLLGMYFMMSAGHFLMFFIGVETASIPLATLVAFNKYNNQSAEAGAKYILTAVFSTGISLFGISMLYGAVGTLYFSDMSVLLSGTPIQLLGMVFFAVGLFFKISLVPFHLWTPDVYEGAPTSVTSYLSVISKGSAVFVLFVIFVKVFSSMVHEWHPVFYGMIIISITVANIFAIRQQNLKRLLAYSAISQAGYLMLAVMSANDKGMTSLVYYILVYLFSNLAVFGVVSAVEHRTDKTNISQYAGLYKTNPFLAVVISLGLFSLAGIPPFAGFFSKYFIFTVAFEQGYYALVFIALANTVISLYYYLMVVRTVFKLENDSPIEKIQSGKAANLSLIICSALIVVAGLFSIIYETISGVSMLF